MRSDEIRVCVLCGPVDRYYFSSEGQHPCDRCGSNTRAGTKLEIRWARLKEALPVIATIAGIPAFAVFLWWACYRADVRLFWRTQAMIEQVRSDLGKLDADSEDAIGIAMGWNQKIASEQKANQQFPSSWFTLDLWDDVKVIEVGKP